ncbi:hypothetical protein [Sedimenticola hydrogenitrophicus]|uniref:hypothetical protein n=1 Tax=Sedimenticola hydrogenitrophicus TaxID=2967975 RepID=UPI0021A51482|nr:hypothetical protein [Sedimenticola hydrogenitrophicus]
MEQKTGCSSFDLGQSSVFFPILLAMYQLGDARGTVLFQGVDLAAIFAAKPRPRVINQNKSTPINNWDSAILSLLNAPCRRHHGPPQ